MRVAAVLLAAGQGRRFGGGKLMADFDGKPMAAAVMDTLLSVGLELRIAVVFDPKVAELAAQRRLQIIHNDQPEMGISHSIRLGLEAAEACDAVMFLAADQPLLTAQSMTKLIEEFAAHSGGLACLRDETHSGNPAVFSRAFYPALLELTGDRGAKRILTANWERVLEVDCLYPHELDDADDPQTLAQMLARRETENLK